MAFTYFFRDRHPLERAVDYLLPSIISSSNVQIWSAGSAMGPEPYTIAILLRERLGHHQFRNIKILATDIDISDNFGKTIAAGRYPTSDLQRLPPNIYERYFSPDQEAPEYSTISGEMRSAVEFHRHDLLTYNPVATGVRLIVCKNVLLHFTDEERVRVLTMFHNALSDDGVLLHEHTQKMPAELDGMFEQLFTDAQIFRKKRVSV
jgi:chemotaxis protein methyltransferase CheR